MPRRMEAFWDGGDSKLWIKAEKKKNGSGLWTDTGGLLSSDGANESLSMDLLPSFPLLELELLTVSTHTSFVA